MDKKCLYLDVCTLCRPFDDQHAMRIRLETDAYYLIVQAIQDEVYSLVVSPVHHQEIGSIKDPQEREEVLSLLKKLGDETSVDPKKVREKAEELCSQGLGVADAAHVAFAESTADYFISCDDKLLKKCKRVVPEIRPMNPLEFCNEEDLK